MTSPLLSLKMYKFKLKKGSSKSSLKALDSGWTPSSAKIQSRAAFPPLGPSLNLKGLHCQ